MAIVKSNHTILIYNDFSSVKFQLKKKFLSVMSIRHSHCSNELLRIGYANLKAVVNRPLAIALYSCQQRVAELGELGVNY